MKCSLKKNPGCHFFTKNPKVTTKKKILADGRGEVGGGGGLGYFFIPKRISKSEKKILAGGRGGAGV